MVLTAIISQGAACVLVVAWPGCIGLQSARGGAVGALQSSYGIPGQEQFTAAMDLAQTSVNFIKLIENVYFFEYFKTFIYYVSFNVVE